MNEQKINRLNELRKLDAENERNMSHRKYSSWTVFSAEYRELITLEAEQKTEAVREQAQAHRDDWKSEPASQKQYDYIDRLGVNLNGRKLTKSEASRIIDAVKNGESVGTFGLEMFDGSN